MLNSLSIVLPVHNAQQTLDADVRKILDVVPEQTGRLEVLIIDDASNDGTEDVAWDLLTCFPQIDFVRNPFRVGWRASLRVAFELTTANHVLIHNGSRRIIVGDIARQTASPPAVRSDLNEIAKSLDALDHPSNKSANIAPRTGWRKAFRSNVKGGNACSDFVLLRRSELLNWLVANGDRHGSGTESRPAPRRTMRHRAHRFVGPLAYRSAAAYFASEDTESLPQRQS